MKIRTSLKAGRRASNYNQTLVRDKARSGRLKVSMNVKAGDGSVLFGLGRQIEPAEPAFRRQL